MPPLNTPPSCTLCGESGHNIRYCRDPIIAYLLVKVRCKKWKASVQSNDPCILFDWLHRLISTELRAILIHKYRVSPKTTSKAKLIAILMEYDYPDATEEIAFWRSHLPPNFVNNRPVDIQNEFERELILQNIQMNRPPNQEHLSMSCDELIRFLMQLMEERRGDRYRFQNNITYLKSVYVEPTTNEPLECSICYEDIEIAKTVRLNCNHEFCGECITTHIKKTPSAEVKCPMCRSNINTVSELTNVH